MLDISPEKLLVLLVLALIVLGPHRMPEAARGIARGMVKMRSLAQELTGPLHSSLQEPRQAIQSTLDEVRSGIGDPVGEIRSAFAGLRLAEVTEVEAPRPAELAGAPTEANGAAAAQPIDPSLN
jgi:sec-independent protein translocase protein TatB